MLLEYLGGQSLQSSLRRLLQDVSYSDDLFGQKNSRATKKEDVSKT
jgi:hypothetical protein